MLQTVSDLSFSPVETENPRTLTRDHIAHYNREGFITGLTAFDEAGATQTAPTFTRFWNKPDRRAAMPSIAFRHV